MAHNLDSSIQQIVARAASQIADAVRANIAEEIKKLSPLPAPAKAAPAAAAPKAAAPKAAAPKAAKAAPKAAAPAASSKKRRGVSEDELTKTLEFITKNPGKRSEEIRKALGTNQELNSKILAKLRELKKVKTKGEKRATTYSV